MIIFAECACLVFNMKFFFFLFSLVSKNREISGAFVCYRAKALFQRGYNNLISNMKKWCRDTGIMVEQEVLRKKLQKRYGHRLVVKNTL